MRFTLPVAALAAAPVLVACTQNATAEDARSGRAAAPITVTSTDTTCELSAVTAPAGTLTFQVTNNGSEVSEFYLYSAGGKRILGEVENIGPGLQGTLIVTADRGSYQTACRPGMAGDGIRADFDVTEPVDRSVVRARDQRLVSRAQDRYRRWVQRQADLLVARTRQFVAAYRSGDDARARALYPVARSPWEAIETVAESFGDLDPRTDAREADLRPGQRWTGWHRIEKDLWSTGAKGYLPLSPARRRVYGHDLLAHVTEVRDRVRTLSVTTDQIANGSSGLMEEVATSKVTGEEESWSHTDLWDFAANVRGARVAFEAVEPLLQRRDPALAGELRRRFTVVERLLDRHRDATGYELYTELSAAEVKRLSDAVNGLSEPLSRLTAAVLP